MCGVGCRAILVSTENGESRINFDLMSSQMVKILFGLRLPTAEAILTSSIDFDRQKQYNLNQFNRMRDH